MTSLQRRCPLAPTTSQLRPGYINDIDRAEAEAEVEVEAEGEGEDEEEEEEPEVEGTDPVAEVVGEHQVAGERIGEGAVEFEDFEQLVAFDGVQVAVGQRPHVSR